VPATGPVRIWRSCYTTPGPLEGPGAQDSCPTVHAPDHSRSAMETRHRHEIRGVHAAGATARRGAPGNARHAADLAGTERKVRSSTESIQTAVADPVLTRVR
jgi:hypothetical protein